MCTRPVSMIIFQLTLEDIGYVQYNHYFHVHDETNVFLKFSACIKHFRHLPCIIG